LIGSLGSLCFDAEKTIVKEGLKVSKVIGAVKEDEYESCE